MRKKTINGCNSGEAYLNVSAEGAKYVIHINLSGKRTEIKYLNTLQVFIFVYAEDISVHTGVSSYFNCFVESHKLYL